MLWYDNVVWSMMQRLDQTFQLADAILVIQKSRNTFLWSHELQTNQNSTQSQSSTDQVSSGVVPERLFSHNGELLVDPDHLKRLLYYKYNPGSAVIS